MAPNVLKITYVLFILKNMHLNFTELYFSRNMFKMFLCPLYPNPPQLQEGLIKKWPLIRQNLIGLEGMTEACNP